MQIKNITPVIQPIFLLLNIINIYTCELYRLTQKTKIFRFDNVQISLLI